MNPSLSKTPGEKIWWTYYLVAGIFNGGVLEVIAGSGGIFENLNDVAYNSRFIYYMYTILS